MSSIMLSSPGNVHLNDEMLLARAEPGLERQPKHGAHTRASCVCARVGVHARACVVWVLASVEVACEIHFLSARAACI
jgi:hypothetical protein